MCNSPRVHPCGVPTAYEGAQTLFIHPIWKWTAVSGSVQPQPRHHGSIWAPPTIWTPPDPNLPNLPLTLTCVKAQWCTNMAFQQHLKVLKNVLYIQYGAESSQWWFTASTMTSWQHLGSAIPTFSSQLNLNLTGGKLLIPYI